MGMSLSGWHGDGYAVAARHLLRRGRRARLTRLSAGMQLICDWEPCGEIDRALGHRRVGLLWW